MIDVLIDLEGVTDEWTENRNGFVDRLTGIGAWDSEFCKTVYIDVYGRKRGKQKRGARLRGGICLLIDNFIAFCKKGLEEYGYEVNKRYHEWIECPKCHSDKLNSHSWESDEETAFRVVTCENCEFEWQEVFSFLHNETVKDCNVLDEFGDEIETDNTVLENEELAK
jgi:transcription elongation factor Elf1